MKKVIVITSGFLALLFSSTLSMAIVAADSAQDPDLSVSPVMRQYPVTTLSSSSAPALFTIKNTHASQSRSLGTIALAGVHSGEFAIGAHSCSLRTLPPGESCSVPVSFAPLSRGTKNAELRIPSDDAESPVLTAYLTNLISPIVEAQKRMPPVLASSTIPETLQAGQSYTIAWTVEGYHDDYTSYAVLFDCTDSADCGASYNDPSKFTESGVQSAVSVTQGNWTYRGVQTRLFAYEWNFTVPATRSGGGLWAESGTDIVARIYRKSDVDAERNNSSVSLLIPGNQSSRYYDTSGRRILKTIIP